MIDDEIVIYDDVSDIKKKERLQWEETIKHIVNNATEKKIPIKAAFELTPECNLECKMCYIRLNKNEMGKIGRLLSADEWITIGREAANEGTLMLILTGGEPLMHPEFEKIYIEFSKMGFLISLFTNGTLINDNIINLFKKYPPAYITFTMYGASEKTYKAICNNGNAYNIFKSNILKLRSEIPNIAMAIRTTLTKKSLNDLDGMMDFSKSIDEIMSINFANTKPVRGAERPEIEEYRLNNKETINILRYYIDKYGNKDEKRKIKNDIRKNNSFDCIAGISSYCISWDGKMLPCLLFSTPYAQPTIDGFKNAWEQLKILRNNITIPDRCIKCEHSNYCGTCPAYIQAESGTYLNNENYKCKYNKQQEE